MALFCKENHCGSCAKAFCCFSCRCKHETNVHMKSQSAIIRKALAPIRNSPYQTEKSLPKIPECMESKKIQPQIEPDRKKNSITIYNDSSLSQLGNQLRPDDQDVKSEEEEKCDKVEKTNKLTDEIKILQEIYLPDKAVNITVKVEDKVSKPVQEKNEKLSEFIENIENIPPNLISREQNVNAGKTPPRSNPKTKKSLEKLSMEENSSVYCACSENFTKSDLPSKWVSATSEITCSPAEETTDNSSIYFACSEFLTRDLSPKRSAKCDENSEEGFDTFRKDQKLASTKLEMTISFAQEACETKSEDEVSSTGIESLTYNLEEETQRSEVMSNVGSTQTENSNEHTLSVHGSDSLSFILDERSSMNIEYAHRFIEPRREYMSAWVRACATQTSLESSLNSLKDFSGLGVEEEKEGEKIQTSIHERMKEIDDNMGTLACLDPTFSMRREHTFWNSFSNSLQRAYNSTKEMCNSLGRRNKSKRERDDTEEPQAKRPKTSILCRPPIREGIKVIFRKDGEFRRPVVGFDKGTQTD